MNSGYLRTLLVLPCLAFALSSQVLWAQLAPPSTRVTGIYSDMRDFDETGDLGGIEIFVVNSMNGYYVLVQIAEGNADEPILAKATVKGDLIAFELPLSGGQTARFRGTFTAAGLMAHFESGLCHPISGKKTFLLKRTRSYWQH
jgi:hypothetical protein